MAVLLVLIWIACAVACASIASAKGHSGCLWGLLGLVFGFFALLVIAVMPAYRPPGPVEVTIRNEVAAAREVNRPLRPTFAELPASPVPPARAEKKCPDCAEMVLVDARVCRHCGYRFDGQGATKALEHQPVELPGLSYDDDQRAAATVLRALAEAAGPMHMGQQARIVDLVVTMRGWGRLGANEAQAVTRWVSSMETDKAGLRPALERVAKWSPRWTGPLVAAADDVVEFTTPGADVVRQQKFLALVRQIAGSKAG